MALTSTNHLMGCSRSGPGRVRALDRLADRAAPWAIVTFYALLLAVTGKWIDMVTGAAAVLLICSPWQSGLRALEVAP